MKKILKFLGIFLLCIVLLAGISLGVLTIAEYRPADVESVLDSHETAVSLQSGASVSIVSWNCGYGALGDNADFFMDGGKSVYTADQERLNQNLEGISETLRDLNPDIILLQEVDINSSRSHGADERTVLRNVLPGADECFAYNFNSLYVPFPIPPIGHVESGLYTLSRFGIRSAERISLPCPFSWPLRIANLKRCLLVSRIPVGDSGRELVLVNLHLEAYDNGEGKEAQTKQLASFLNEEYALGNYVVAGGDFNQLFSNIENPYPVYEGKWQPGQIDAAAFENGFSLLMDSSVPSCRSLDQPLAGSSADGFQFYLIDGFIVSENVRVNSLETLDKGFICSDHNPVSLEITLLPAV